MRVDASTIKSVSCRSISWPRGRQLISRDGSRVLRFPALRCRGAIAFLSKRYFSYVRYARIGGYLQINVSTNRKVLRSSRLARCRQNSSSSLLALKKLYRLARCRARSAKRDSLWRDRKHAPRTSALPTLRHSPNVSFERTHTSRRAVQRS